MDDHGTTRPLREAITDLVEDLEPTARRLGCSEELAVVEEVLARGASAERQRAVAAAAGGDLTAVVDSLLEEFRSDRIGAGAPGGARPSAPRAAADPVGTVRG